MTSRDHQVRILASWLSRQFGMERSEAILMMSQMPPEERKEQFANYIYRRHHARSCAA